MTLQDAFGRRFTYLRLSITDVCNFRCNYCLPDGYQCNDDSSPLDLDEIARIAHIFARLGTRKIRITGGEPSVRRDLVEIIRILKQTPGIEQVAITTNGWKLPQFLPQWLEAGLDSLNVSIDSLDPRQFQAITGHDRLSDLLTGIEQAQQAGFERIKVNAVLMREHNSDQLPVFLDWLRQTPVTLRFIELMQTGSNQAFFDANHLSGADIRDQLLAQGWQAQTRTVTDGPASEYWHPEYQGKIGLIMPYSPDFCASCNRLRVSAQGKLHLCLFGDEGYDLRPHLNSTAASEAFIQGCLKEKKISHFLHDGHTGQNQGFAGIGG